MRPARGWVPLLLLLLLCVASSGVRSDRHGVTLRAEADEGRGREAGSAGAGSVGGAAPPPRGRGRAKAEDSVTETTKVVAFLLLGFMAFEFALLWLISWPDPNIRSSTWKIISSTISIYLAVLLNNAIAQILLSGALGPEWHKSGEDSVDKVQLLVHFLQFVAMFALVQVLCYSFRETDWLYAVQVITGHLLAFAGVGGLEKSRVLEHASKADPQKGAYLVSLAVVLAAVLLCVAARALRTSGFFGPGGEGVAHFEHHAALMRQQGSLHRDGHLDDGTTAELPEIEEWREAVCEAENDGCAIVASYLAYKVVLEHLSKYAHEQMLEHHTTRDLLHLLVALLCSVVCLLIHTYVKRSFAKYNALVQTIHTSAYARTVNTIQLAIAMSMSWFGLDIADLSTFKLFPDTSHELDKIIGAAILTAGSFVGILLLDAIADRVGNEEDEDEVVLALVPSEAQTQRAMANRRAAADQVSADWARHLGHQPGDSADAPRDVDYLAKAVRVVIVSFSLAVGSAWESAFQASLEVVVETTPVMKKHEVVAGGMLALINCALMFPGWLKILVPMARTTVHEHKELMRLSGRLSDRLSGH